MQQLFKVAGVSTFKNEIKVRFANDLVSRFKLLKKGGSDPFFVELPKLMTKIEACEYLLTLSEFSSYRIVIENTIKRKMPKQKQVTNTPVQEKLAA